MNWEAFDAKWGAYATDNVSQRLLRNGFRHRRDGPAPKKRPVPMPTHSGAWHGQQAEEAAKRRRANAVHANAGHWERSTHLQPPSSIK